MELLISDLAYAYGLKKSEHAHDVIVSVIDSNHFEYGLSIKENCNFHILEIFADTENCNDPLAPTQKQIEHLIRSFKYFIDKGEAKNCLIHCFAGVSRSTAVGIIFMVLQGYSPRKHLIQLKRCGATLFNLIYLF